MAGYTPTRLGGPDVQMELFRRLIAGEEAPLGKLVLELRGNRTLRLPDGSWAGGTNLNLLGDPAWGVR